VCSFRAAWDAPGEFVCDAVAGVRRSLLRAWYASKRMNPCLIIYFNVSGWCRPISQQPIGRRAAWPNTFHQAALLLSVFPGWLSSGCRLNLLWLHASQGGVCMPNLHCAICGTGYKRLLLVWLLPLAVGYRACTSNCTCCRNRNHGCEVQTMSWTPRHNMILNTPDCHQLSCTLLATGINDTCT
jgi:hypothetical protein